MNVILSPVAKDWLVSKVAVNWRVVTMFTVVGVGIIERSLNGRTVLHKLHLKFIGH